MVWPSSPSLPPGSLLSIKQVQKIQSGINPSCQPASAHVEMEMLAEHFHHCCKDTLEVFLSVSLPWVSLLAEQLCGTSSRLQTAFATWLLSESRG